MNFALHCTSSLTLATKVPSVRDSVSQFKPGTSLVNMPSSLRAILCVVLTLSVRSDIQINALDTLLNGFCATGSLNGACDPFDVGSTAILFKNPLLFRVSTNPGDVQFLLYPIASNPQYFQEIVAFDSRSLNASSFDASKPVKLLIHGFLSDVRSQYPQNVKNAYLQANKDSTHNVIIVDWGKIAKPRSIVSPLYYPEVTKNVGPTGEYVGNVIIWLRKETGLDLRNVHLVGHSLGAHVSGWAGATVYKKTGEKVGRITALDPAGPLFITNLLTKRIDKTDALFVDSYHTNALKYGTTVNVGHVDFYLNGGTTQRECLSGVCSHNRCHQIFSQMILEGSPSQKSCVCNEISYLLKPTRCCTDKLVFGEHCSEGTSGVFYANYDFNCNHYKQVSSTCLPV